MQLFLLKMVLFSKKVLNMEDNCGIINIEKGFFGQICYKNPFFNLRACEDNRWDKSFNVTEYSGQKNAKRRKICQM